MRCLYCGKELALLKRLTSGGDFCSEAHRQSYQDQFNELALGRLDEARPAPERFPEEEDEPVEVGVGHSGKSHSARGATRTQRAARGGSAEPPPNGNRPKIAEGPDAAPFVPDWFEPFAADEVIPVGTEPPQTSGLRPEFPWRDPYAVAASIPCAHKAAYASRVRWADALDPVGFSSSPRGRSPEAREFSRGATTPVPLLLRQGETFMPAASQEEREINLAPQPPRPANLWRAGAPEFAPLELTLGDWSRLDGRPLGSEEWLAIPEAGDAGVQASNNIATLERAVTSPPASAPQVSHEKRATPLAAPKAKIVEPERAVNPLPVTLHGVGPVPGKLTLFSTLPEAASVPSTRIPSAAASLPIRPLMVLGTAPAANAAPATLSPVPVAARATPAASAPPAPTPVARTAPPVSKSAPAPTSVQKSAVTPQPSSKQEPAKQEVAKPEPVKPAAAPAPAELPDGQPVQPAPVQPVQVQPAATNLRAAPGKVRRDVRVITPVAPAPAPGAKPQGRSDSRPEPKRQEAARTETPRPEIAPPAVSEDYQAIHLPEEGRLAGLSSGVKMGLAAAALLLIVGLGWLIMNRGAKVEKVDDNASAGYDVGLPLANSGWVENWVPESSGKRISVLKGSQPLSHYRMEFQAQIENKAIGWMFRGMNPKNYYVAKIEALKPGLEPTVALVHYAVIDGKPELRTEKVLPFPTKVGMMYKIRFEAVGSKFTAWVQDQKIDEWHDTRIGSGALGMYSEGGETGLVNGIVNVTVLVPK